MPTVKFTVCRDVSTVMDNGTVIDNPVYIGIDLGGSFIKGVLTDARGTVLAQEKTATEREKGVDCVLDRIAALVDSLVRQQPEGFYVKGKPGANVGAGASAGAEADGDADTDADGDAGANAAADACTDADSSGRSVPAAVGIGIPGMLDASRQKVIFAPNLGWRDIQLQDTLEDKLGIPVFLENDANVAALGEAWLGAGRDKSCFLLITVGTGIGSGLILEGKLFTGAYGLAAEMGHMTIVPQGLTCSCGRKGCLETLVSAPAILRGAQEEQIVSQTDDARQVLDLANGGHEQAALVVGQALEYLAIGLKNALVLLDLDLILIGGGIGDSLGVFMEVLEQKTLARLPVDRKVTIKGASLGNSAGALGAARLGMLSSRERK